MIQKGFISRPIGREPYTIFVVALLSILVVGIPRSAAWQQLPVFGNTKKLSLTKKDYNHARNQLTFHNQRRDISSRQSLRLFQQDPLQEDPALLSRPQQTGSNDDDIDNDTPLGKWMRGLWQTGMKDAIHVNSIVVAKADIPSLGIWMDQSYELQSIYLQGVNPETNAIEKIPLDTLIIVSDNEGGKDPQIPAGYTQYIELFNAQYHDQTAMGGGKASVKVTPEEVGLTSLKDEVVDSVIFALPMLGFWTAMAWTFASNYNARYGGNFLDALFRT